MTFREWDQELKKIVKGTPPRTRDGEDQRRTAIKRLFDMLPDMDRALEERIVKSGDQ